MTPPVVDYGRMERVAPEPVGPPMTANTIIILIINHRCSVYFTNATWISVVAVDNGILNALLRDEVDVTLQEFFQLFFGFSCGSCTYS